MKTMKLEAQKRDTTGKKMRSEAERKVPAVIYGSDVETANLWVDATAFSKLFTQAGTNTVVSLVVEGAAPVNVLVYDLQTDPVTDKFTHIDFYAVNMKEKVEAEIPLAFVGVSAAVKELGGTLIKNNDMLTVSALPADLPHEIEVDLTALKTFDDNISVSDIKVGDKIDVVMDADTAIVSVSAPRTEEEMAELDSEVDADVSKVEGAAEETGEEESEETGEEAEKSEDAEKKEEPEEK